MFTVHFIPEMMCSLRLLFDLGYKSAYPTRVIQFGGVRVRGVQAGENLVAYNEACDRTEGPSGVLWATTLPWRWPL